MRHPAYPEYKESGVQWLGNVPVGWASVSLKWVSQRYAGGTPDKSNDAYWEDGHIPWLNSGSVNDGYIIEASAFITREGFANSSARWIPENALVMALAGQGKTKGMVAQLGIRATCNQSMAAIIAKEKFTPRFLYWWLVSNYQNIRNMAGGEQRDGLNLDMLGSIPCPQLPLSEQTTIADFLDRETGRIDGLVAKNRRLIELLREKRTALVSRTVTRGLPADAAREFGLEPHTRFKDSGIDWLGEVPEGWILKAIKWETQVQRGASPRPIDDPVYFDDGGEYSWVRISDVTSAGMYLKETEQRLSELGNSLSVKLQPGSLFLSIAGTVGKPCITLIKCCIHDGFVYFPKWKGESRYLFYIFASGEPYKGLGKMGTQLNLNTDTVGSIVIGIPSIEEQNAIANYLDRETSKIDRLVEKVEVAVGRLQEYRTALITAAVTGKIDVREAVNSHAEAV